MESFYSNSSYLWYSFVCCKDVLTQSKFTTGGGGGGPATGGAKSGGIGPSVNTI